MTSSDEIRWQQRHENFGRALLQLEAACRQKTYSELERAGLVRMFEFSFELAWKTLKDLLFYEGFTVGSPREAIRQGFTAGLLTEEQSEVLLEGLEKRNLLSHTYQEQVVIEAVDYIRGSYVLAIRGLYNNLESRRK